MSNYRFRQFERCLQGFYEEALAIAKTNERATSLILLSHRIADTFLSGSYIRLKRLMMLEERYDLSKARIRWIGAINLTIEQNLCNKIRALLIARYPDQAHLYQAHETLQRRGFFTQEFSKSHAILDQRQIDNTLPPKQNITENSGTHRARIILKPRCVHQQKDITNNEGPAPLLKQQSKQLSKSSLSTTPRNSQLVDSEKCDSSHNSDRPPSFLSTLSKQPSFVSPLKKLSSKSQLLSSQSEGGNSVDPTHSFHRQPSFKPSGPMKAPSSSRLLLESMLNSDAPSPIHTPADSFKGLPGEDNNDTIPVANSDIPRNSHLLTIAEAESRRNSKTNSNGVLLRGHTDSSHLTLVSEDSKLSQV